MIEAQLLGQEKLRSMESDSAENNEESEINNEEFYDAVEDLSHLHLVNKDKGE